MHSLYYGYLWLAFSAVILCNQYCLISFRDGTVSFYPTLCNQLSERYKSQPLFNVFINICHNGSTGRPFANLSRVYFWRCCNSFRSTADDILFNFWPFSSWSVNRIITPKISGSSVLKHYIHSLKMKLSSSSTHCVSYAQYSQRKCIWHTIYWVLRQSNQLKWMVVTRQGRTLSGHSDCSPDWSERFSMFVAHIFCMPYSHYL